MRRVVNDYRGTTQFGQALSFAASIIEQCLQLLVSDWGRLIVTCAEVPKVLED